MNIIINPGSNVKGGTFKQAKKNANKWLKSIHNEGFLDVKMSFVEKNTDGDWVFKFTHLITKKEAILEIHGFTKNECDKFIFHPRVYWNGSSTAEPIIDDWLTDDFRYKIIYYHK